LLISSWYDMALKSLAHRAPARRGLRRPAL
jgi:hypothetical protein